MLNPYAQQQVDSPHRIVIVGGGAAGLELATRLGNGVGKRRQAEVTLIDRCPTHFWKPLLHEVASGQIDASSHQIDYASHAKWNHFRRRHSLRERRILREPVRRARDVQA